jgi:hypothetical protein
LKAAVFDRGTIAQHAVAAFLQAEQQFFTRNETGNSKQRRCVPPRMRVFEHRVLRDILGLRGKKFYNKVPHEPYYSSNIILGFNLTFCSPCIMVIENTYQPTIALLKFIIT